MNMKIGSLLGTKPYSPTRLNEYEKSVHCWVLNLIRQLALMNMKNGSLLGTKPCSPTRLNGYENRFNYCPFCTVLLRTSHTTPPSLAPFLLGMAGV